MNYIKNPLISIQYYNCHIPITSTIVGISTQSICAGIKGYSPITSAILGTSAIQADSAAPQPSPQSNTNSAIAVVQRSADDPQPIVKRHFFSLETPAAEGDAVWLCFCRRGALLRWRESALLEKIQLFERRRSEFWIFFSGFSRFPAS